MRASRGLAVTLSLMALFFGLLTLTTGATPWEQVWSDAVARFTQKSSGWNPLLDERLPRLVVIICTGASLAVSGSVTQSLFCNPIASPSVLGITAGGTLCAVGVLIMGWQVHYPFAIPLAAFTGCLMALIIVYNLSRQGGRVPLHTLILTGTAVCTVLMTVQGALIYAMRDHWQLIQAITEWEAGSTYDRAWQHVHMQLPLAIVGLTGCWRYRNEINILALGDEEAANLGVDVHVVRWRLFLCVALLAGGALASLGTIAFFGLILPHVMRRLAGPDQRRLLPLCMLAGSTALLGLDVSLRIFSIHAFSVGNISAVLGGIFFIVLLFEHIKKAEA